MQKKNLVLAISFALATATSVQAQESAELATVTVEDTQPDDSITTTVERDTIIDNQAKKISEVLNHAPGVEVGGTSAAASMITVRGVPEYQLNIKVDGAPQQGYIFHHGGGYGIDPQLLKQVTVDTGTNSIRDVDSLSGSIEFETVDASDLLKDGQTFGGSVGYGFTTNSNASDYSASAYGRIGDQVNLLVYGHYTNGHEGESGDGTPVGNATEQKNGLVKASWDITPGQKLGVSYEHYYNDADTYMRANFGYQPPWNEDLSKYKVERNAYNFSYDLNPEANPYLDLSTKFYHTKNDVETMDADDISTVTTKGISVENTSQFDTGSVSHEITVGAEAYQTKSDISTSGGDAYSSKLDHQLIFVEDKIGFLDGKFELTPAIRYDHYKTDYNNTSSNFNAGYGNVSFALSGRYNVNDDFSVYAAATEIYRAPEMQEVVMAAYRDLTYNKDSETKGINYQIGTDYDSHGVFTDNDRLSVGASVFYTDFSHYGDSVDGVYLDAGEAHSKGAELKLGYEVGNFSSGLSYSRARTEFDDSGWPTQSRSDMGDTYKLSLGYRIEEIDTTINWNSTFVKGLNTSEYHSGDPVHKVGYGVSDLSLTYQPDSGSLKGLTVNAGVYNIFDKNYVNHASYYYGTGTDEEMGRNFRINLRYDF